MSSDPGAHSPAAPPIVAPAVQERRVLILAPVGRTAEFTQSILERAGLRSEVCLTATQLCTEMRKGVGAVVMLEEGLQSAADLEALTAELRSQPPWSDIPVTVFVADLTRLSTRARELSQRASGQSLVVLERPIRPPALVSLMSSLLQARERQYQLRELVAALGHAQLAAEAANRGKSEFLTVMSHELRTPLNAIIGFAELLQEGYSGPLGDLAKGHVSRITSSARHLLGLIEDILAYARIEAGKEQVRPEPVIATHLAGEVVAVVEPLAEKKGLALRLERPESSVLMETDSRKLRQILLNLLSNAVKFTQHGEVVLTVDVTGNGDGGGVVFWVRDTGDGIAAGHLDTIFEPFEQVSASAARRQEGTGLGLGVSRKLARLLGGDLTVESEAGRGSTFTLALPLTHHPTEGQGV